MLTFFVWIDFHSGRLTIAVLSVINNILYKKSLKTAMFPVLATWRHPRCWTIVSTKIHITVYLQLINTKITIDIEVPLQCVPYTAVLQDPETIPLLVELRSLACNVPLGSEGPPYKSLLSYVHLNCTRFSQNSNARQPKPLGGTALSRIVCIFAFDYKCFTGGYFWLIGIVCYSRRQRLFDKCNLNIL